MIEALIGGVVGFLMGFKTPVWLIGLSSVGCWALGFFKGAQAKDETKKAATQLGNAMWSSSTAVFRTKPVKETGRAFLNILNSLAGGIRSTRGRMGRFLLKR